MRDPNDLKDFEPLGVYGTLRKGWGNHRLIEDCEFLRTCWLKGYKMTGGGIPFAMEGRPKQKIYLEIYSVPRDRILGPVDRLEGHPHNYLRVWVESAGCWIYTCSRAEDYAPIQGGLFGGKTYEEMTAVCAEREARWRASEQEYLQQFRRR